ncbi:MAG: hypothetical protein ABIO44_12725 [Saprospiraceae bacterium]
MEKLLPVNLIYSNDRFKKPNLHFYQGQELDLTKYNIALIAYDHDSTQSFRKILYTQQFEFFRNLEILDLGDAYAMSLTEMADMIQSLIKADVYPILVGFPQECILSISNTWENEILPHSICWVTSIFNKETFDVLENNIFIKNQYYLGLQRQLSTMNIAKSNDQNIKPMYLSEFRKSNQNIDAYTRNSELFYFNMNAVRFSDFPASINPSGFFSEEIISIAKLSGSSDRSLLSVISSWNKDIDKNHICNTLVSQIIWYMIEGYTLKLKDKLAKNKNLSHYVVEVKNSDIHLDFYKSEVSGKWWIKEPGPDENYHGSLIPCTYEEYLKTVQENLPERLLELIYH